MSNDLLPKYFVEFAAMSNHKSPISPFSSLQPKDSNDPNFQTAALKTYHEHLLAYYQQQYRLQTINHNDKIRSNTLASNNYKVSNPSNQQNDLLKLDVAPYSKISNVNKKYEECSFENYWTKSGPKHTLKRKLSSFEPASIQPLDLTGENMCNDESKITKKNLNAKPELITVGSTPVSPPCKKMRSISVEAFESKSENVPRKDRKNINDFDLNDMLTSTSSVSIIRPKVIKPKPTFTSFMISNLVSTSSPKSPTTSASITSLSSSSSACSTLPISQLLPKSSEKHTISDHKTNTMHSAPPSSYSEFDPQYCLPQSYQPYHRQLQQTGPSRNKDTKHSNVENYSVSNLSLHRPFGRNFTLLPILRYRCQFLFFRQTIWHLTHQPH